MATSILETRDVYPAIGLATPPVEAVSHADAWSIGRYAREQVRGLVRQLFLSDTPQRINQAVFTAADPETDVAAICCHVAETLASETQASVVVVCGDAAGLQESTSEALHGIAENHNGKSTHLQQLARRVKANLWVAPDLGFSGAADILPQSPYSPRLRYARLAELRREFEYSIVQSPPAGESSDAAAMGRIADGVILVLAAHKTRRSAARKIQEALRAQGAQLLGIVLSERIFPIPEAIYRRL